MAECITQIAIKDILTYLSEIHFESTGTVLAGSHWVDYVSTKQLYTKETIRLNRQLGIHKINKQNNSNNFGRLE